MSDTEQLEEYRAALVERLAREAYSGTSAHNEDQLSAIARIKAAIDAVDFILANDIPRPPAPDPTLMIF